MIKIPFNKPFIAGKELYYIARSVLGGHIAGDGLYTKKCQTLLEETFGAKKVLLTTSCTTALEMAAILCDLKRGAKPRYLGRAESWMMTIFFLRNAL